MFLRSRVRRERYGSRSPERAGSLASPWGPHKAKTLTVMHGVFVRACGKYKLKRIPVADVEKPRRRPSPAIEIFSPEEIWALVRA